MITRRIIDDPAALEALAPAWRALLKTSQIDEVALTPTWIGAWWKVFGPLRGRQLRVVTFHRDGELVGLAPLLRRRHVYGGAVPFWRIELCCTGEDQEDEICSPYVGILAARGTQAAVADALVASLVADELGTWDEISLTSLIGTDSMLAPLKDSLRRARIIPEVSPINAASFIPLPASWDEYLAGLPGQRRYFVRRTLRDLETWLQPDGIERRVEGPADLARGQAVLYALHRERWRAEGRDGVFESPRFKAFHEAIMRAFVEGREGASLELCWLEKNGQPISVLYNIIYNDRVYFYQSGRSLDVPKSVRPGIGAHLIAIRRHIEHKRREYDFLEGAHMYKSQLSSEERALVELRALSPSFRARLLEASRRGLLVARDRARALRSRWRLPKDQPSG